jgi:hypothetical protein
MAMSILSTENFHDRGEKVRSTPLRQQFGVGVKVVPSPRARLWPSRCADKGGKSPTRAT